MMIPAELRLLTHAWCIFSYLTASQSFRNMNYWNLIWRVLILSWEGRSLPSIKVWCTTLSSSCLLQSASLRSYPPSSPHHTKVQRDASSPSHPPWPPPFSQINNTVPFNLIYSFLINRHYRRAPLPRPRIPPRLLLLPPPPPQSLHVACRRARRGQDSLGHQASWICQEGYVFNFSIHTSFDHKIPRV